MAKDRNRFPVTPGPDIRVTDGPPTLVFADPPPPVSPSVKTNVPNTRILEKVEPVSRQLVMQAARPGDPEPYFFGRHSCRPLVVGADDTGDALILDLLWGVGEFQSVCNAIPGHTNTIWMPDIGYVEAGGTGFEHFTGTAGQSASTIMTALKGSYDALPNKAHSIITMDPDWNLNIRAFHDGVKVIDPRNSPHTRVWTENPALILADIFDRCGYTPDWASVATAADWSDEGLDAFSSPLAERNRVGGQIRDRQELRYWVHALAQYAGCYIDVRGGYAIFVVDKPRSSTHTVTVANIVEGSERLTRRGSKDAPEKVTVNYEGGTGNALTVSYGTSGGTGTETSVTMPFWDNQYGAGRKAKEIYFKGQHELESLEFVGHDDGLALTLGDLGTITLPSVGLNAEPMALVENEPVSRGRWKRKYIGYDANDYPDTIADVDEGTTEGTLYNPYFPPPGPTPTLSFDTVTTDSPNWDRIKIDFAPQTWAYLKDYYVTVTTTADESTILYSGYVAKGSETGSPLTITTYTDFPTDFTTSPVNVYRVNVYLRSVVSDGLRDVLSATPGTADIANAYTTTAKHLGNGDSPSNYYQTGGGSIIDDSPRDWNGLLPFTGSGDSWQQMTLVFCVYPVQLGDTGNWYIFGAESGQIIVGNWDLAGGIWVGARSKLNELKSYNTTPSGSPSDYGGMVPNQWNSIMISIDGDISSSPVQSSTIKIWANGSEIYSGAWGASTLYPAQNPMSQSGYCWVGRGDGFSGAAEEGMDCYLSYVWCDEQYLDPSTYWSDFFDANNKPKNIGADGSLVTGSAPATFVPDGDFTNNLGTAPSWDMIGTVPDAPSSPTD